MAITLQANLNSFHFERTVDWRVQFSNLALKTTANYCLDNKWFFAKSIVLPLSCIDIEDEGLVGFYQSKIVIPTLTIEIYTDNEGVIESAMRKWNMAAFTTDGFMIPPNDPTNTAVQDIVVHRIDPVKINSIQNLATGTDDASSDFDNKNAIEIYKFRGYLARLPDYSGSDSAAIRTLTLNFKICSMTLGETTNTKESKEFLNDKGLYVEKLEP